VAVAELGKRRTAKAKPTLIDWMTAALAFSQSPAIDSVGYTLTGDPFSSDVDGVRIRL